jgi:predicted ATP-grasp superfamily ATP-dependent carboligase
MKKVVILDAQSIQTLPTSRSLKKMGFYVILICDNKNSYGFHTRFADQKIIAPSIQFNEEAFHRFFIEFVQSEKIDVVIPTIDYSARYLSKNKELLKQYTNFVIPSYAIFLSAYNKNNLMKICEENGFPHPKTIDLAEIEISKIDGKIDFPALIKPNFSSGARGISPVKDVGDVETKLPDITKKYGDCHLQEFIPPGGRQFKVELYISKGQLINSVVIDKIRFFPPKGGSSCFVKTIVADNLVELCYNVANRINWDGFIDFDLIEDPRDNIVKVIEINPRLPAMIRAAAVSGVDFIENIVDGSLNKTPAKFVYEPGKYLRFFGMDFLWLLTSPNRFKTHPSWLSFLFSKNEYFEDGSSDDILPLIYGTLGSLRKMLNPQFRESKHEMI